MKTKKVRLEALGFTAPTIARLQTEGMKTLADLIEKEEQLTCSLLQKHISDKKSPAIETLRVCSLARHAIKRKANTIHELLKLRRDDVFSWGMRGSMVETIVVLVDMGYTEDDGPFLSRQDLIALMQHSGAYRALMKLDSRSAVGTKFKRWFNSVIEGVAFNTEYRSNRKLTVKPFVI